MDYEAKDWRTQHELLISLGSVRLRSTRASSDHENFAVSCGRRDGRKTLSSCATHETTATTANPTHRTYSRNELNTTGQPDIAGAIEAVNPDAQITR